MNKSFLLITAILLSSAVLGQDYEAPVLDCVEVNGDDVNLIWTPPANVSGDFNGYEIYTYTELGNFSTQIATYGGIGQITHVHTGTLAATESIQYFILATYGPSGNLGRVSSDTISSIDLSLFIDNGTAALLEWNYPFPNDSVPGAGEYEVQMFYQGVWSTIGTTEFGDEQFEYTVDVCHGFTPGILLRFRVRYLTTAFCGILSNVREGIFQDLNPPSEPIIETVTVDTTNNKAVICWLPSPEADTGGYIVQSDDFINVTNINDPNDSMYLNPASLAASFSEGYVVIAYDTCMTNSGFNTGSAIDATPQFTLVLDLDFITCQQAVEVTWNSYLNWPVGVSHYEVYGGLFGQPMMLIDSVGPTQNSAIHEGVELNMDYCYIVKAVPNDGRKESLSSKSCIFTDYPDVPNYTYLANVSVTGPAQIELKAIVDTTSARSNYAFQKLDRFGEEFDTFVTVPLEAALGAAQGEITVFDNDVVTDDKIFSYRLISLDSCGIEFGVSDTSKNILLEIFPDETNRTNTLTWQAYEKWAGNISEYHIYRELDGEFLPFPYAVVDSTRNYFVDDLNSDLDYILSSNVCYYVEAI